MSLVVISHTIMGASNLRTPLSPILTNILVAIGTMPALISVLTTIAVLAARSRQNLHMLRGVSERLGLHTVVKLMRNVLLKAGCRLRNCAPCLDFVSGPFQDTTRNLRRCLASAATRNARMTLSLPLTRSNRNKPKSGTPGRCIRTCCFAVVLAGNVGAVPLVSTYQSMPNTNAPSTDSALRIPQWRGILSASSQNLPWMSVVIVSRSIHSSSVALKPETNTTSLSSGYQQAPNFGGPRSDCLECNNRCAHSPTHHDCRPTLDKEPSSTHLAWTSLGFPHGPEYRTGR